MSVTEHDIRKQIRRLTAVYNAQKSEDELVAAWKWVLGDDVSNTELMAATSEYAKSGSRYFPNPGQIRELALADRREHMGNVVHSGDSQDPTECKVCGAKLRVLSPEEQVTYQWDDIEQSYVNVRPKAVGEAFGILHDQRAHRQAGEPIIGDYYR